MSDIKEKISKCLSLAKSPEPEEAKAALLMARRLMAKHKLSKDDLCEIEKQNIIRKLVDVNCTKMSNSWTMTLAQIVAKHHCCTTYVSKYSGGKTFYIGFIGLEDDFKVCEQTYMFAYNTIMVDAEQFIKNRHLSITQKRQAKNSFGTGFCNGLKEAYEEQDRLNEEWGIVLVIPRKVNELMNGMKKKHKYNPRKHIDSNGNFEHLGYNTGKNFDPTCMLG